MHITKPFAVSSEEEPFSRFIPEKILFIIQRSAPKLRSYMNPLFIDDIKASLVGFILRAGIDRDNFMALEEELWSPVEGIPFFALS